MGKFATFLVGGVVGAAAAFFLSPRSGADNRSYVSSAMGGKVQIPASVQEKASQLVGAAASTSTTVINTVVDNAADARKNVADRMSTITPPAVSSLNSNGDELREKIDAARERIATQVAKNAEAARDAAVDKVPVVIDAAQGAAQAAQGAAATAKDAAANAASTVAAKVKPASQD